MEFLIPALALGGLYKVSQQQKKQQNENFEVAGQRRLTAELLPNMDIPNMNYPDEYHITNAKTEITSQLSTLNQIPPTGVYTDKYFDANMMPKPHPTAPNTNFRSMTGDNVDADYFRHNNMVPFFGSKSHALNDSNATESTLDNYIGSASQHIRKKEQAPMFSPDNNYQWAHGMPSTAEFVQSRMNPSMNMANVKPFEQIQVGPGLGLGYTAEGSAGYNSGLLARDQWLDKNVDELRVANKQKASGLGMLGYEGPAKSHVMNSVEAKNIGIMEKHRVDRMFEMGPDRYFTTTGAEKAPTARSIPLPKHVSRPETSTEYAGVAGNGQTAHIIRGEYMPTHNQQLGTYQLAPAYALNRGGGNEADFGAQSVKAYPNNRSTSRTGQPTTKDDSYYGAIKSTVGAAVAPFVDMLKPSRKENTVGNLRPYQNAKAPVESSYVFNPNDKTPVTIRQTTENSKFHMQSNANQHGGAYQSTPHQAAVNERDTTTDFYYSGNAAARGEGMRTYDAEYRQRNNDIKSSTIQGRLAPGGMSLLNGQVNMSQRPQENMLRNERPVDGKFFSPTPSMDSMGALQGNQNLNLYSNQQLDRNNGDILSQLKGNPYTHNVLNVL